jgi:hypothetical protein
VALDLGDESFLVGRAGLESAVASKLKHPGHDLLAARLETPIQIEARSWQRHGKGFAAGFAVGVGVYGR